MAVIHTPQGRVIGLIIKNDSQPKPEPVPEKAIEADIRTEHLKKPGRPAKK